MIEKSYLTFLFSPNFSFLLILYFEILQWAIDLSKCRIENQNVANPSILIQK